MKSEEIELLCYLIGNLVKQEEIDKVLVILQNRTCDIHGSCKQCPWKWSVLCKFIYEYIHYNYNELEDEEE